MDFAQEFVARPLKRAYSAGWHLANPARIAAGDGKAAERKRSRSEADTGQRTGASFGLCSFFGRENRLRFSRRAGLSMGTSFGLWVGLNCWPSFGLYFGLRANI